MIAAIAAIASRALPPRSRLFPPPKKLTRMNISTTTVMRPAKTTATVITRISRLPTCESSWASTPSSSARSSRARSPVVTATTACLGSRPAANALGALSSIMYKRGFGSPAVIDKFSSMRCNSRNLTGSASLAPTDVSATLSENQ